MELLRRVFALGLLASSCIAPASARPSVPEPVRRAAAATLQPAMARDFPDPSILQDDDGKWYAFATSGNGKTLQAASAPQATGPWTWLDTDVLPSAGAWTTNQNSWAPDVQRLAAGRYVMFYAGQLANNTAHHCVGTATASSVLGPYKASAEPLYCHLEAGGAIDPAGYYDKASDTRWIVYKIDGNSIGNGGDCGNGIPPLQPTPILLQQMSKDDWTTPVGGPTQILDRTDDDGPLVEAPNLIRKADGTYILFFSSHCYSSSQYDVKYATAAAIKGPYARGPAPLIQTGEDGVTAPGGGTSTPGGDFIAFHANCPAGRCMYVTALSISGAKVKVAMGG